MKRFSFLSIFTSAFLLLSSCDLAAYESSSNVPQETSRITTAITAEVTAADTESTAVSEVTATETVTESPTEAIQVEVVGFDYNSIPAYSGSPYCVVNNNVPYFDTNTTEAFEIYSDLDSLGRCGVAFANVCKDIMPTEERGEIGSVKPTGWHSVKYDWVDGNYLFNRCHLIGFQLAGENANTKNLITGTRSMNVQGMLPFENLVDDYVNETNNHVLYRVTPVFIDNELVARGVLMEARSVEDNGDGIEFNVFCYNVEPDVEIDYATGESWAAEKATEAPTAPPTQAPTQAPVVQQEVVVPQQQNNSRSYILNTNTKKFHFASCSSIKQMSDKNKQEYTGSRDDLIAQGYSPCGRCCP